ncbi:phosphatase PAP2 family protein [Haloimpatiens sp. FM7315]|uniref:phosphatase PAP2 family protein n=1 Tax=Haloimpatiens sp. FM7315 TaxID=3298609 RepID=UPI00370BC7AC
MIDKIWNKYANLIFGSIFILLTIFSFIKNLGINYIVYNVALAIAAFTIKPDLVKETKLKDFLITLIPVLTVLFFAQKYGYQVWGKVIKWETALGLGWNWNDLFKNIPFNDAAFTRLFQAKWLNEFFKIVYNNGFILPVVLPIYRAIMCKDTKKIIRYALSGHLLQIFLISPFYATIRLQEVWYVLGHADRLQRNFTPLQAAGWTLNCFPSMHTSIAFAMFLVALHEKDKIFKWFLCAFCLSVIYSTMYMEIHWIIDVVAGVIFAAITVKLVDILLDFIENKIAHSKKKIKVNYLYCNPEQKIKMH